MNNENHLSILPLTSISIIIENLFKNDGSNLCMTCKSLNKKIYQNKNLWNFLLKKNLWNSLLN